MKNQYFTRKTFSYSCPNRETLMMMEYLCDTMSRGTSLKGKEIDNQHFQQLVQNLIEDAYRHTPSALGL